MNPSNVATAYDRAPEREWHRLGVHRLEFEVAKRNLFEFITSQSRILDVGGGPGRYAITLAREGHIVTLSDLSQKCLDLAREKADVAGANIQDFVHTDARDLHMFEDESFDVVLCMGPLYHLVQETDRVQTMRECMRVLAPGGLIFTTFITSYAPLIRYVRKTPAQLGKGYDPRAYLPSGTHIPENDMSGLPEAYFIHPNEVQPFMERFTLDTLKITGLEGIALGIESTLNTLTNTTFLHWVDLMYETASDPVTWGGSEHMMYIGKKQI